jgi:hypothetical protein
MCRSPLRGGTVRRRLRPLRGSAMPMRRRRGRLRKVRLHLLGLLGSVLAPGPGGLALRLLTGE